MDEKVIGITLPRNTYYLLQCKDSDGAFELGLKVVSSEGKPDAYYIMRYVPIAEDKVKFTYSVIEMEEECLRHEPAKEEIEDRIRRFLMSASEGELTEHYAREIVKELEKSSFPL